MAMNKFLLTLLIILPFWATAQIGQNKYLVYFADKANTPYTTAQPEAFLSQRAIQRRQAQGIPVTASDLPVDPAYIQQILDLGNVQLVHRLKWLNAVVIHTTDPAVLDSIAAMQQVDHIESSPVITGHHEVVPHRLPPPAAKDDSDYGLSLNQIEMLNGLYLHDAGFKGAGMLIGVFDGGFSQAPSCLALADLFASGRIAGTRDFVDGDQNVYHGSFHGTFVLSTMAGFLPELLIGTAPEASYYLFRTENVDQEHLIEEANWVAAAEFADSAGVDVFNTSLGYTEFDVVNENHTWADLDGNTSIITRGADIAASKGILVVNSAGNSGDTPWHYIGVPADGDSVLAIGAVWPDGEATSFSSRGPSFDGRVKPNVMAQGGFAVVSDAADSIMLANGTSFSGPIMAGMAASLWQKHPTASSMEVFYAIEQSAHLYQNPNDSMGYGIPDFQLASEILGEPVSVDQPAADKAHLSVYPNPITNTTAIHLFPLPETGAYTLQLYSATGRLILEQIHTVTAGQSLSLRMPPLAAGLYLLSVKAPGGPVSLHKLVK